MESAGDAFAGWLHRLTGGRPFYVHETVRWLEELGHLRVDDENGRVELLDPLGRLPLPFNIQAVMDARFRRLPPSSARLLHLLTLEPGGLELETLRRRFQADDEVFEEAIAHLRQREFLLRRSARRPIAVAGTLWRDTVAEAVRRFPRMAHRPRPPAARAPASPLAVPMANVLARLDALRRDDAGESTASGTHRELARVAAALRGRTGPGWDSLRGRLAALAARTRWREGRLRAALGWTAWGRGRLDPAVHPGLRRSLLRLRAAILEEAGRAAEAHRARETAWAEAMDAGHLVAAAELEAVVAEGARRLGETERALARTEGLETRLRDRGLAETADLARYTRLRALLDARLLDEAGRELEPVRGRGSRSGSRNGSADLDEIAERLEALNQRPPLPVGPELDPDHPHPGGWGWGLDDSPLWTRGREALHAAAGGFEDRDGGPAEESLDEVDRELDAAGLLAELADLRELRLWAGMESGRGGDAEERLERVAALHRRLALPSRSRFLAEALRQSPAVGLESFARAFRPHLLRPAGERAGRPGPRVGEVRLRLTGLVRVERPGSVWPLALWPEWWRRLWLTALHRARAGRAFPLEEAARTLAEAGDAPDADPVTLLQLGNQLLRGHETVPGGLHLRGDAVRVEWTGIDCDVNRFRELLAEAGRLEQAGEDEPARALRARALEGLGGRYLPGIEDAESAEARAGLHRAAAEASAGAAPPRTPEARVAFREGPGRIPGVAIPPPGSLSAEPPPAPAGGPDTRSASPSGVV